MVKNVSPPSVSLKNQLLVFNNVKISDNFGYCG